MSECQRARGVCRLTALLVASVLGVGCPSQPPSSQPPEAPVAVGPAPLRRLSNREYLNALADLFPDQHPALPELPNDTPVAGSHANVNLNVVGKPVQSPPVPRTGVTVSVAVTS